MKARTDRPGREQEDASVGIRNLFGEVIALPEKARSIPFELLVFTEDQILEAAFQYFRQTGFPYHQLPAHISMQEVNALAICPEQSLIHTQLGYWVADNYHPHRFSATVEGKKSPITGFSEDKTLRHALKLNFQSAGYLGRHVSTISLALGTQGCSNFRPGFATKIYRRFCKPGNTVLDTSTGYGGRLVGFLAARVPRNYIGVDPNTLTHKGNIRMVRELGFANRVKLYNLPAEEVPHEWVKGRCDFAFTSPPYFTKEHYSSEPTQSWVRYQTPKDWQDGFLAPMLALQYAALKPRSFNVINVADVTIRTTRYLVVDWTKRLAHKVGFKYIRTEIFPLNRRFGAHQSEEVAVESVLIFQK